MFVYRRVYLFERPVTSRDNDVLYFSKRVIFQDEKLFVNNESLTTLTLQCHAWMSQKVSKWLVSGL